MKKLISLLLVISLLLFSFPVFSATNSTTVKNTPTPKYNLSKVTVSIDKKTIKFKTPPIIQNNISYAPVEEVLSLFADFNQVKLDKKTQILVAQLDGVPFKLAPNQSYFTWGNLKSSEFEKKSKALYYNNRIYIPISCLADTILGKYELSQTLNKMMFQTIVQPNASSVEVMDSSLIPPDKKDVYIALLPEAPEIIYIEANPDKGFYFPYYVRIPSKSEYEISTKNKYLVFDMINIGLDTSLTSSSNRVKSWLENLDQKSMYRAKKFGYPIMMPVVPRLGVSIKSDTYGRSFTYEHALVRSSLFVKELTTIDTNKSSNIASYSKKNIDYKLYYDLDKQVAAMIQDAIQVMQDKNIPVKNQVIMDGYSASGAFTDRFSTLYPDLVKIVVTGATIPKVILPLKEYQKEVLNYPIGIADFEEITGSPFDIEKHNKVARLIYMGELETEEHNTVHFLDCYSEFEQKQMIRLFGEPILERAYKNISLYRDTGGKALFVFDKWTGHSSTYEMNEYIQLFIKANADSDTPVFPEVTSKALEAYLVK